MTTTSGFSAAATGLATAASVLARIRLLWRRLNNARLENCLAGFPSGIYGLTKRSSAARAHLAVSRVGSLACATKIDRFPP